MKSDIRKKISNTDIAYGLLFVIYFVGLLVVTLLDREIGKEYQLELELFWSYKETFLENNKDLGKQIIGNILVFVPWGIFVPNFIRREHRFLWTVGSACVLSVIIEGIQLMFRCGLCELDDVMNNTIGAVIGYGVCKIVSVYIGKKGLVKRD